MDHHNTQPVLSEEMPNARIPQAKRRKLIAMITIIGLIIGVATLLNLSNTRIKGVSTYRNWGADAIVSGGAISEKELLQKYDQNASGIQHIYNHYGITRSDLTGQTSKIKHGTIYQDGRVVVNGQTVATGAFSVSRKPFYDSRGNAPKKVNINGTNFYEGPNMSIFVRSVDAYVFFRDGQFYRAVISSCANPVMANPTKKSEPIYSCNSLDSEKIDRTRYHFTSSATAQNGADIIDYRYDFGDGNKAIGGESIEHTYAKPGKYTARLTVSVLVDGKTINKSSGNCKTTVNIEQPPKSPIYACNSLTTRAVQSKDRTYSYLLDYTADNGASLTKAVYDFGDGTSEEFSQDKSMNVEHQYAKSGDFTTTATLYFNVDGKGETSDTCKVTTTVPKPDNCTMEGKEDLPKNSPECTQPPIETPPELPETGVGEWLGASVGLAALAAAIYYWKMSHKNLKHTMLKK